MLIDLLFQNEDNFMLVLKDILEMDNLVRISADREHGNLVKDFHRTVHDVSNSGAKFGRVRDPCFTVDAFPHCCKDATETKIIKIRKSSQIFKKITSTDFT